MSVFDTIKAAGIVKQSVTIDLGDCDEAFRGATFDVWVTPTRAHWTEFSEYVAWLNSEPERVRQEHDAIQDEAERAEFDRVQTEQLEREMNQRLDHWLAETWINLDQDETTQIREHLQGTFPDAWQWLYNHTLRAMREYRENLTKN